MLHRKKKKDEINQLINTKYTSQIAQLEADGIKVKNKQLLMQLMEKANGQVDVVKQLLVERNEQKHHTKSASATTEEAHEKKSRHEINADDIDNLRRLRSAGVHGNPVKILALFHECNENIEMTAARLEKQREQREQHSGKRKEVKLTIKIEPLIKSFFVL
jgi:hypothetical protein